MFKDYALLTRETTLIGGKLSLFLLKKKCPIKQTKEVVFAKFVFKDILYVFNWKKNEHVCKSILSLMGRASREEKSTDTI